MSWTIVPLNLGVLQDRPKESITFRRGTGEKIDLVCISWLLLGEHGPIVIDTGPGSAAVTSRLHPVVLAPREPLTSQLRGKGVAPADVRTVVLTHLHWDHCHGTAALPGARVLLQEEEIRYAVYPLPCDRVLYEFASGPPFLADLPRMVAVAGRTEVAPGIVLIPTPGHSPGHQSVLVETEAGPYLIAGDHYDLYENLHEMCPSGPTPDLARWYRSFQEVERLRATVLPGHDPAVLEQESYG
ncbi:MAG: N-acyl homoserine lactonase family protein [Candidatus Dormibacteraceae bacterium]